MNPHPVRHRQVRPIAFIARVVLSAILSLSAFVILSSSAGFIPQAGADTGGLIWPANGFVSQNAGEHHASSEHVWAIDIASWTANNPVVAAASGTIVTASSGGNAQCYSVNHASNGLGNYITIQHSSAAGTTYTTYAHLASLTVTSGAVSQGQQIGIMGQTGCATGPHVHFAVSTCPSIFSCTEWNSPDPSDNTVLTRGAAIANSSYPGVGGGGVQMILDGAGQIWAKSSIGYGNWSRETPSGEKSIAAGAGVQMLLDGAGQVWAESGIGNAWTRETPPGERAIATGGGVQMILDGAGQIWAKSSIGYGNWSRETPSGEKSIAAG